MRYVRLLQQFQRVSNFYVVHVNCHRKVVFYIVKIFVRSTKNPQVLEEEGITGLNFLEEFAKYSNLPKSSVLKHIPVILLDQYNTKIMK